jgi:hypothetical protein
VRPVKIPFSGPAFISTFSFIQPNDEFIDFSYEEPSPQAPLVLSSTVTPAVNSAASNIKIDPAVSQDAAALFEPLGSIPTNSHITQVSAMAPTTRATPTAAYDPLVPPPSFSSPNPHVRSPSDDISVFVSVPASLHPLSSADPPSTLSSSHSARASSGSSRQPHTTTTITNNFMMGARRRHAVNANGILSIH